MRHVSPHLSVWFWKQWSSPQITNLSLLCFGVFRTAQLSCYQMYGWIPLPLPEMNLTGTFLWSVSTSCLKRLSGFRIHSSVHLLSASRRLLLLLRAVPKWLCLPLLCLHLLSCLVVFIHLFLCLFFCHPHLLAWLFWYLTDFLPECSFCLFHFTILY